MWLLRVLTPTLKPERMADGMLTKIQVHRKSRTYYNQRLPEIILWLSSSHLFFLSIKLYLQQIKIHQINTHPLVLSLCQPCLSEDVTYSFDSFTNCFNMQNISYLQLIDRYDQIKSTKYKIRTHNMFYAKAIQYSSVCLHR